MALYVARQGWGQHGCRRLQDERLLAGQRDLLVVQVQIALQPFAPGSG